MATGYDRYIMNSRHVEAFTGQRVARKQTGWITTGIKSKD